MSHIKIGLRTKKSVKNIHGFVDVDEIPSDEVCVVCLNGGGCDSPRRANGEAKIVEQEVLNKIDEKVPVYSAYYDFDVNVYGFSDHGRKEAREYMFVKHRRLQDEKEAEGIRKYVNEEDLNPQYVEELYQKTLYSRLRDEKGNKLDAEEGGKRLRKINFVAHCHGAFVALKLEQKLEQDMKDLGYTFEERKKMLSQVLVVAHAPICPLGVSKGQFVSFASLYDQTIPFVKNYFNSFLKENIDEEIKKRKFFEFKPCYLGPKQGNLFLIKNRYESSLDLGNSSDAYDEHADNHFSRSMDTDETFDSRLLKFISRNILRNGIKNSLSQDEGFAPLPNLTHLVLGNVGEQREKLQRSFTNMIKNGKELREQVFRKNFIDEKGRFCRKDR